MKKNSQYFAIFCVAVLLITLGMFPYYFRNIHSADGYYVRLNNWGSCMIVRTDYRGGVVPNSGLGIQVAILAPLIIDKDCSRDISKLQKGDLPQLEVSYWEERGY